MNAQRTNHERHHIEARARDIRAHDPDFARWAVGYGMIEHEPKIQCRVHALADELVAKKQFASRSNVFSLFRAADMIASAGMWLVAHMTYTQNVHLDGRPLDAQDFKSNPEGHTGGALNMVPAYAGYLLANTLTGETRSWLMGQGHCVAAIDAVNVLVNNLSDAQARHYGLSDDKLTQFVRDFYSCEVGADGRPSSPLGSHVNATTAGGMIEGGYLGFAELLYPHMPLPGEKLVAFLSDGAFEEQRGSDWAPRWWRAEDTGLVAPIMIANGRRIDQRSSMAQDGGTDWFREHLQLNGFDPIGLDGRDPASLAWGIIEIETRLSACSEAIQRGDANYPVPLHYGVAETVKGFGFPGAGTNRAHNLPLEANPRDDDAARDTFNAAASKLFVPIDKLRAAAQALNNHTAVGRPKERDHPMVSRKPLELKYPEPRWDDTSLASSPMEAIDTYTAELFSLNKDVRVRVGNPDEMRSNRMNATLDLLKHRVTTPEPGIAEAVDGAVITALNEEAVICAALANKGGLSLAVSYEAFAVKMLGAIRQDLIFTRHLKEAGKSRNWPSLPLITTSHAWENGKNELSHQDTTLAEAFLGEMSDTCRVVFPADWNSALAMIDAVYKSRGEIWNIVCPKRVVSSVFSQRDAERLCADGAIRVSGSGQESLILIATGAYQLDQTLKASERLERSGLSNSLVYIAEPGRFRIPRDETEAEICAPETLLDDLFPAHAQARVFAVHTRAEAMSGCLRPIDTGAKRSAFLGFRNRGGTLDVHGMLFANGLTWAHIVERACHVTGKKVESCLSKIEQDVVLGIRSPEGEFWQ